MPAGALRRPGRRAVRNYEKRERKVWIFPMKKTIKNGFLLSII